MSEGFKKFDGGKSRLDLLPFAALEEIGRVLDYGAKKYGENNWRKGITDDGKPVNRQRYVAALLRHITAHQKGQNTDSESGLPHLTHAACCILFLIEMEILGIGADGRYPDLIDAQDPLQYPLAGTAVRLPDGTSHARLSSADLAKTYRDIAESAGNLTWSSLLHEATEDALTKEKRAPLSKAVLRVAVLALDWYADLQTRG